jgi:hypothetical protein
MTTYASEPIAAAPPKKNLQRRPGQSAGGRAATHALSFDNDSRDRPVSSSIGRFAKATACRNSGEARCGERIGARLESVRPGNFL